MDIERAKQLYDYRSEEVCKEKGDGLTEGFPRGSVIKVYNKKIRSLVKEREVAIEVIEKLNLLDEQYGEGAYDV